MSWKKRKKKLWAKVLEMVCEVKEFRKSMDFLPYDKKIEKLREFQWFKIPNRKPYRARRKEWFMPYGLCKVCKINESNCQHHMIMLINGGSNKEHNRIQICDLCHSKIHDWLKCDFSKVKQIQDELTNNFFATLRHH